MIIEFFFFHNTGYNKIWMRRNFFSFLITWVYSFFLFIMKKNFHSKNIYKNRIHTHVDVRQKFQCSGMIKSHVSLGVFFSAPIQLFDVSPLVELIHDGQKNKR